MTEKALKKLNERQMKYCKTLSYIINRAREKGLVAEHEKASGKLRGYLECLCQMEMITANELKALYLWFFAAERQ